MSKTILTQQTLITAIETIKTIVTPDRISNTHADRIQHGRDQSSHPAHLPDLVVWPHSSTEVSQIVAYANQAKIPITAWGAGSSLEGNPIPLQGGIVLNFQQMDKIIAIHHQDFQITVQPGVLYKDMNKTLARYGLFFAPDPGANASVGGMLANNAAGIRTVKYGATRDNVLALKVVLANGEIIQTGSRSIKQSSGYDLTHLFVGSEGTLGIITEATLSLDPLPEHFSAVIAAFPSVQAAAETVFNIIGAGLEPTALELLNSNCVALLNTEDGIDLIPTPNLLMEFNGASDVALEQTLSIAQEICNEQQCQSYQAGVGRQIRNQLWETRHKLFEISLRHYPGQSYLITDAAVPISQYPVLIDYTTQLMAELNSQGMVFGHAGDGNLHTTIFFPPTDKAARIRAQQVNDGLVKKAIDLGGTATGEHGVGIGKQKYMLKEHGENALNLMKQLKITLDPHNILNPGKVIGNMD